MYNLLYDGTFAGFLTALNRKMHQPMLELSIKQVNGFEEDIYSQDFVLETHIALAEKMLAVLKKYFIAEEINAMKRIIKQAKPGCEDLLCQYIFNRLQERVQVNKIEDDLPNAA